MKAAIQKEIPSAPHETLLVVDGSVGRNAVDQAAAWRKYVGVSGLAVTKLDGTARGGFVVSVVKDQQLPVKFIGVGEKIDDLRDFEAEVFVDALLGTLALKSYLSAYELVPNVCFYSYDYAGNDEAAAAAMRAKASKMIGDNYSEQETTIGMTGNAGTGTASDDPAARLRNSFAANQPSAGAADEMMVAASPSKPKRTKRPKPQSKKKSKSKK